MLCEDRGCEWTDILESVVSSMNATVCSATGVSPHYVISGRHPNVGLPRINDKDITANTPTAYGMQVNALLRQVHNRVALASNETDHKYDSRLSHLCFHDPIQVGDKILLHRPKSTIAHNSHLPWIGTFDVVKSNDSVLPIQDENGNREWIH